MDVSQKINTLFLISGKEGREGEVGGQRVRQVQVGSAPAYLQNSKFDNFLATFFEL